MIRSISPFVLFAFIVSLQSAPIRAQDLPREARLDMLVEQITAALKQENHGAFLRHLKDYRELDGPEEPELLYHEAVALKATGNPHLALEKLTGYINTLGRDGANYNAALRMVEPLQAAAREAKAEMEHAAAFARQLRTTIIVPDSVGGLGWNPDGQQLAIATVRPDALVSHQIWDTTSAKILRELPSDRGGSQIEWSPDGRMLAYRSHSEYRLERDRRGAQVESPFPVVRIIDAASDDVIHDLTGTSRIGHAFAWSPDGHQLVTATSEDLRLWEVGSGKQLRRWALNIKGGTSIRSISWSPDGRYLAAARGNTIQVWDMKEYKHAHRLIHTSKTHLSIYNLDWSPDSLSLVSAGEDGRILIWDISTGQSTRLAEHPGLRGVAWHPEGKYIASISRSRREDIKIWDLKGRLLASLPDNYNYRRLEWSSDGSYLATGSQWNGDEDKRHAVVRIWQPELGM